MNKTAVPVKVLRVIDKTNSLALCSPVSNLRPIYKFGAKMHKMHRMNSQLCIKTFKEFHLRQLEQSASKLAPETSVFGVKFETNLKILAQAFEKVPPEACKYTLTSSIC